MTFYRENCSILAYLCVFVWSHRDRTPTKLLGLEEWRRGLMFPRPLLNVWSSTPRQTRRTCWIWTLLQSTETRALRLKKNARKTLGENHTYKHFGGWTLPVLQQSGHVAKLWAAGGNRLDAAPQSAVLPRAGGHGASQVHLAHVQNISD